MPFADTDTGTIYFQEYGVGSPLMIAHGGPGAHHGPYRQLDPIGSTRRLIYWDHRGHGRSDRLPPGEVAMSLFADDTIALADHLEIESFALFGHSFGGWVAQETALRYPQRISALILVATTPGQVGVTESPSEDQGPPPPAHVAAVLSRQPTSDADLLDIYTELAPFFTRGADPGLLTDGLDESLLSADSFIRVFGALAAWSSVDRLDQIACPTLVVAGQHDVFCSVQQLERITRRIPQAEQVIFDAGHFIWLEQPEPFMNQLTSWLAEHETVDDETRQRR
jgi:proline iminopeptidase